MRNSRVRTIRTQLGLGAGLMKLAQIRSLGFGRYLEMRRQRTKYLAGILDSPPANVGAGDVSIHMLLNRPRILEGLWMIASIRHFARVPFHVTIHDDGSLRDSDAALVSSLFPGTHFVRRADADAVVDGYLRQKGLTRSLELRRTHPFALKYFDLEFFSATSSVVYIDSDVLFFGAPAELIEGAAVPAYSMDSGFAYCLTPEQMRELLSDDCVPRANAGVFRWERGSLDFARTEEYLAHGGFWTKPSVPNPWAEQSLRAMEMSRVRAKPLPDSYAIAPRWTEQPNAVCGHYCGGIESRYFYYTKAIPWLSRLLLKDAAA